LCRPLDTIAVKGREQETTIFELINQADLATDDERTLCAEFAHALEAHRKGDNQPFKTLKEQFPDDGPTNHYLDHS